MKIPTMKIENPILIGRSGVGGSRVNIHMADEGYLLEQKTQRNMTASVVNGMTQVANIGTTAIKGYQEIKQKQADAKREVDKSTYMTGLQLVADSHLNRMEKEHIRDEEQASKMWQESYKQYNTDFTEQNKPDKLFDGEMFKSVNNYYTNIELRSLGKSRKTDAMINLSRVKSDNSTIISGGLLENMDNDMKRIEQNINTQALYEVISDEEKAQRLEVSARQYKVSAWGKNIQNNYNVTPAYMTDKTLTGNDIAILTKTQDKLSTANITEQLTGISNAIGEGKDMTAQIEDLSNTKDYRGKYIITGAMSRTMMKWQNYNRNQKRQAVKRGATKELNDIMQDVYRTPIDDPQYDNKVKDSIQKLYGVKNLTYSQERAFDVMLKLKQSEAKKLSKTKEAWKVGKKSDYKMSIELLDSTYKKGEFLAPTVAPTNAVTTITDDDFLTVSAGGTDDDGVTFDERYSVDRQRTFNRYIKIRQEIFDFAETANGDGDIRAFTKDKMKDFGRENYQQLYQGDYISKGYYRQDLKVGETENIEVEKSVKGKTAIFNKDTKQFIRWK